MRQTMLCVLALVPLLYGGDPPKKDTAPRYSRETLDRIRQSLTAQIAVRDQAEGAMRAPDASEAASLANTAGGSAGVIALKNGGVALGRDASQLSFAVVERGTDGKLKVTHAPATEVRKGAVHAR